MFVPDACGHLILKQFLKGLRARLYIGNNIVPGYLYLQRLKNSYP